MNYRQKFPYCEACARLERSYPVERIEIHHIEGRISNDHWNLIAVCREHHRRGTHHDQEYGTGSVEWNHRFLAIKALKKELTDEAIEILGTKRMEKILEKVEELILSKPYKDGLAWGWYNA